MRVGRVTQPALRDTRGIVSHGSAATVEPPGTSATRYAGLDELRTSRDPLARRLASALSAKHPAEPLRSDIERIRRARQDMLEDETRIEILNYGAGSRKSTSPPTASRMAG